MNKLFDCVEMKHKGAELIYKKIAKLSYEKELQFWKEKTEFLKNRKKQVAQKDVVEA